ncbi:L-type lectin-domain containing receptor kinase IX.1-like [Eucalyptus grandis]|uniref:L-type lectin-domain containing receptor kinase IX.1-like n=1 Tax=Eucalyptus grandis TaxID=71139 RepID=UPI00192EEB15|nr:L-type lectin-domain containing receptor kinase IX.1-like [Eucalyptus grandis]
MGYMAPECFYIGKISKESDVNSFGIVFLEIANGKRVVDSWATEGQVGLLDWVWELYGILKLRRHGYSIYPLAPPLVVNQYKVGPRLICDPYYPPEKQPSHADSAESVSLSGYHEPVHLWDKLTRNVADFTTQFGFAFDSEHNEAFGNGLMFFLSPNGSDVPSYSGGCNLTVVSGIRDPSTTFVAVEFNAFYNSSGDPQREHVSVDLNNIIMRNMSVLMIDAADPKGNVAELSYSVNLTEHLPEWVTVGFSAATGLSSELPTLYSWEFSSNLRVTENVNSTINSSPADRNTGDKVRAKGSKSWVWSVIGLASLLLTLVLGLAWFGHRSKKKTNNKLGEEDDVLSIDEEFDQVTGPKKFSFWDLSRRLIILHMRDCLGKGSSEEFMKVA